MKTIQVALFAVLFFAVAVETRAEPRLAVITGLAGSALPSPGTVGVQVTFTATVVSGVAPLYSWDFGDLTPPTSFASNPVAMHTYANPGHYTVTLSATDLGIPATPFTFKLMVHWPIPATRPTNSSTIILDKVNANRLWCVNPDQDTVAVINTTSNTTIQEIQVGKNPRTLAQAADGTIWVASQQHPSISVIQSVPPYALQHVIPLPHGSLPYGICMTPDGSAAYVSLQGSGGVQKFSTTSRGLLATTSQPPSARGIAVTSTGRVLVTRFISPQSNPLLNFNSAGFTSGNHGEVVELNSALGVVRTINLAIDPGPIPPLSPDPDTSSFPTATNSRGVPNYLTSLVVTPDERRAWVPSKKDNVQRGTRTPERDGLLPGAELTYRAMVSSIDLATNFEPPLVLATIERFDVDNGEMPQAACTSFFGDYLYVALQGNNKIQIRDLYPSTGFTQPASINGFGDFTGTLPPALPTNALAPQGLVLDPATNKLYSQNYMSRTISVFDTTAILNGTSSNLVAPVIFSTLQSADLLAATVLLGKQVFYNAGDPRMSLNGYISCAGCHLDGGSDMRVWDFTNRNEGFRNTVMLQGRGGTGQGNVHWSANFNEIQDFENDIQNAFGGTGFSGGAPNPPMGTSNANRPAPGSDLDALAAYVASLTKVSRSPFRNPDGSLTASGAAGEVVFKSLNCVQCHGGPGFTDSQVFIAANTAALLPNQLHDVGTLKPTSGKRLNDTLTGIDTPTLKGIWQTAPYFHDGSAAALLDVVNTVPILPALAGAHGGMHLATLQQRTDLARYLNEIDELDALPAPLQTNTVTLGAITSARPYSLAPIATGSLPFVDRSYTIATTPLPAALVGKFLLRTAEDDKLNATPTLITFTLTLPADVYVFTDSRATVLPSWLTGWTRSATEDLRITPGTTTTGLLMQAYKKNFLAGPVTLGGNLEGGAAGALRNFFVIINQSGSPLFEEGPISKGEWAHDKDQDGDGLHDEYEVLNALNPWLVNTGGAGTIPDEDKVTGTTTRFLDQLAFETPPAGGGGCGLGGLEVLIPFVFLRLFRNGNSRRRRIRTR